MAFSITKSAKLSVAKADAFFLLNDIRSYPRFTQKIAKGYYLGEFNKSFSKTETLRAVLELEVNRLVSAKICTKNMLIPFDKIIMTLDGENEFVSFLEATWILQSLSRSSCKIELDLTMALHSRSLELVARPQIKKVYDELLQKFLQFQRN